MKIKEICALTGLTERTIRYYEEEKLISPKTTRSNGRTYRDYSPDDASKLTVVSQLRRAGLSLDEIRTMQRDPKKIAPVMNGFRERLGEEVAERSALLEAVRDIDFGSIASLPSLAASLSAGTAGRALPKSDIEPDFGRFDEEPPEDVYRECQMRVLDKKGDIFGTMTPLKGQTWVYDEIYLNKGQSPEVWYEQMEWADNPYLDEKEVEMLSNSLSDDVKDSRRYGRFKTYNGLVYPEFDVNVHVIEPFSVPEEWQADISIDPGLNNPLSCHFYAVDGDGTVYVVAEHFEAGKEVDYHVRKINELAEKIGWKRDARGRLHALIDSAANQKTLASSKSVTELFVEKGIVVNPKVNKDLFSGIAKIKNMLAARPPKILIFSSCVNLIRELKSYAWAEGDRPKKFDDHALDELRYFVMSGALPQAVKPQKTEIQKDIESLIKLQKRNRQ